jgi:hypothetical protein
MVGHPFVSSNSDDIASRSADTALRFLLSLMRPKYNSIAEKCISARKILSIIVFGRFWHIFCRVGPSASHPNL